MDFVKNKRLADCVTMRIGGPAKYLATVHNEQDVTKAAKFAKENNLAIISMGRGSNIIFSDNGFDGLVLINEITGIDIDETSGQVTAGAGELTDDVVKQSVEQNLVGIEALSGIPGTIGAAPVNNIGAYGQEFKDTLLKVRALDTTTSEFVDIAKDDCGFSYRDSIFKSKSYGRYIITQVTLQLKPVGSDYAVPNYPSLVAELEKRQITKPSPGEIRQTILELRNSRLPDPANLPNSGSFFKNPIISKDQLDRLLITYPDIAHFAQPGRLEKLSAGWLIEQAGLKGYRQNGLWVYDKLPLVLVNESSSGFNDLTQMIDHIVSTVLGKFGVMLQVEPEIIR